MDRRGFLTGVTASLAAAGAVPARGMGAAGPFWDAKTARCFTRTDLPQALRSRHDDVVRRIHLEVWKAENAFRDGDTVQTIASRLGKVAVAASEYARATDRVSLDLLRAEVLAAWIRTNMEPFPGLNAKPGKERVEWNRPERVLSHSPRPRGNCDGYSRLTTAIGYEMGLKTFGIGGTLRQSDGAIPGMDGSKPEDGVGPKWVHGVPWNHGWNAFQIGEKYAVADLSAAWHFREERFRTGWKGKTDGGYAIPLDAQEWEVFLATHWTLHWDWKIIPDDSFLNLTLEQWKAAPVRHVERLRTELRLRDSRRNQSLQAQGER